MYCSIYLRPWVLLRSAASEHVPYIADLDIVSRAIRNSSTLQPQVCFGRPSDPNAISHCSLDHSSDLLPADVHDSPVALRNVTGSTLSNVDPRAEEAFPKRMRLFGKQAEHDYAVALRSCFASTLSSVDSSAKEALPKRMRLLKKQENPDGVVRNFQSLGCVHPRERRQ